MTVNFALRHWSSVTSMMDMIDLPAFLLQVNGARDFTFRALNAANQTQVGLDPDKIVGHKPEALLPARLAETVIENYEECRITAKPFTYEEHLHLPAGAKWWKTTLSPIMDATGRVTMILGIAVDISDVKEHEFHLAEKLSKTVQQNRKMLGTLSRNVDDMRGPFQSVLGLFSVLRDGFIDFGDGKQEQIDLCEDITRTALLQADALCQSADDLIGATEAPRAVDLGHLCRDIVAFIDPDRRFCISFPSCKVMADPTVLELLLRLLLENAAKHAHSNIRVTLSEEQAGHLWFQVLDDGVTEARMPQPLEDAGMLPTVGAAAELSELGRAQSLIDSIDGAMTVCRNAQGMAGIAFRVKGTLFAGGETAAQRAAS